MEPRTQDDAIAYEATVWASVLPTATPQERAEFVAWLKASRKHAVQYLNVLAVYDHYLGRGLPEDLDINALLDEAASAPTSVVVPFPGSDRPARDDQESHAANASVLGVLDTSESPARTQRYSTRRRLALIAAVFLGVFGFGFAGLWMASDDWRDYTTAPGEVRSIRLNDGSVIHLNTSSKIAVHLAAARREIRLLAGEALFTVARDPTRPFRVQAGTTLIQAIGTQFNVQRAAQGTTVAVIEGRVQIVSENARPAQHPASPTTAPVAPQFTAGEGARISTDGQITRLAEIDSGAVTAWRQRQLVFRGDTLAIVAEQFNRYNATQVRLESERLKARRVHGVFDADAPESFLRVLSQMGDVAIERRGGEIILRDATDLPPDDARQAND